MSIPTAVNYRARMGWADWPWYTYRSYYTTARPNGVMSSSARQEEFQDAPEGVPQDPTGSWTRRHDEYTPEELAGGRT